MKHFLGWSEMYSLLCTTIMENVMHKNASNHSKACILWHKQDVLFSWCTISIMWISFSLMGLWLIDSLFHRKSMKGLKAKSYKNPVFISFIVVHINVLRMFFKKVILKEYKSQEAIFLNYWPLQSNNIFPLASQNAHLL